MATSVQVLFNKFPDAALKLRQRSGQITQQSAGRIAATAKRLAPVRTGHLRDSIEAIKGSGPFSYDVVAGAEYAAYVEYGTRHNAPHPYLRPAFEQERPTFLGEMDKLLDQLV